MSWDIPLKNLPDDWPYHYHTESYYQSNGKWEICGQEAGMLIPLKVWELVTGNGCKKWNLIIKLKIIVLHATKFFQK